MSHEEDFSMKIDFLAIRHSLACFRYCLMNLQAFMLKVVSLHGDSLEVIKLKAAIILHIKGLMEGENRFQRCLYEA